MKISPNFKKYFLRAVISALSLAITVFLLALPFKQTQFLLLRAAHQNEKNLETKIAAYQKFVKKYPYYISPRLKLAWFYAQLSYGNPAQRAYYNNAIEQYQIILKLNAENKIAMASLADLYSWDKKFTDAEKLLEKLLKLYPKDAWYHFKIALNYLYQGMDEKAQDEAKLSLSLNPRNSGAHLVLGSLYEKKENIPAALAEYKAALQAVIDSKQYNQEIDARLRLGRMYFKAGLIFDGVQEFEKVTKISPRFIEGYLELANAYYYLGLFDKSISTLNSALKISIGIPHAYRMLGLCYLRKTDYIASLAYFKKAQALGVQLDVKFIEALEQAAKEQQKKQKTP